MSYPTWHSCHSHRWRCSSHRLHHLRSSRLPSKGREGERR
ncbi:unnamed protein product [Musa acuminata subsp. malaccensis]|uniref:(wild Malaysian banana) hypothetical protein n=1 Tax=Musa acuminata subsp. malaccensis TaxID=214687 RepID=A0A804IS92_MUSAM|nr:unnamed protein product [Musa acuminata subsp. malaccensis]